MRHADTTDTPNEIAMRTPSVSELTQVAHVLAGWQHDGGPLHLHPGDLGWHWTQGADATAAALRIWSAGQRILAVGLLDGRDLLRMAVDPRLCDDDPLASRLASDIDDPQCGVLPAGAATIEARAVPRLTRVLSAQGWQPDEPWTPLRRDLTATVEDAGVRVDTIGLDQAESWVSVHWSAFRGTPFTDEDRKRRLQGWLTMATGPLYACARSLAAYSGDDELVAVATIWSAGTGRPGLIEPMGVHKDHRGHGYGTAITLAAAANLREMGASSAIVGAENSNVGAIATYLAAGLTAAQPVSDLHRPAGHR